MARALARGWGEPVLCSDAGSGRATELAAELGGEALDDNGVLAERAELVLLCHKPAQLDAVAAQAAGRARAVASVLGPTSIAELQAAYPGTPVFRLMPNTPVEVRRGTILYAPADGVDPALEARVLARLETLGRIIRVPERLMGAAGALSGVGPAYMALVAEAQVDAAVREGLSPGLAAELVATNMEGTAALLAARHGDTLAVRREVASPGGSTARGLAALERGGLRAAFADAARAVVGGGER